MTYTDFRGYSHAQLRAMTQALNPGEVMAAADPWRRAADTLKAIRTTLTRASTEAATSWEGSTSDAFHSRMLHLATTINTTASYANDAANTLKAISEAMAKAKRDMPEEPGGWAQFKDGVGDTFSSLFGADDEDSRTDLVNQKKAEAATVLQTLAMHYRTAAPMLKPPPPPGQPGKGGKIDYTEIPEDDTGAGNYAAVGGFLGGVGIGNAGAGAGGTALRPQERAVADPRTAGVARPDQQGTGRAVVKVPRAPSDPGIKGGVAMPPPKATPVGFGAGSVVDGAGAVPAPAPAGGGHSLPGGSGTSILGAPGNAGSHSLPNGPTTQSAPLQGGQVGSHPSGIPLSFGPSGGQGAAEGRTGQSVPEAVRDGREGGTGRTGAGRSGAAFGAEGIPGAGGTTVGAGSGRGRGGAEGAAGRAGGTVVGVGDRTDKVGGGKQAFTEGGSGVGARGRIRPESGGGGPLTQSPMIPLGGASRGRPDGEERKGRPDYLVEDEETWAPDEQVNPNVVE
ncbi:WXG100 family type VII secretion target [Kitasatospora sp. NPDC056327]|uniref:WXG100 family type VII secretion target n=1 Tax=Kitasatospora sp. NPDC056327 TaxID=3345785 RepID=UPI0035D6141D